MSGRAAAIVFAAIACLLLLLPFAVATVWDGAFPLTVHMTAAEPIDTASLRFATCWREEQADALIRARSAVDMQCSAEMGADGSWTLHVPCSGRSGPYGLDYSRIQPSHLVVEFRTADPDAAVGYKKFAIPPGRGPRELRIALP